MKRLFLFTLAAACCLVLSRESAAQQIDGYTSIECDPVTNTVEAYSETSIDYDSMESYNVMVILRVTGDDGTTPAVQTRTSNGQPYVSATAFFTDSPGVAYTARGTHKAVAKLTDQEQFFPYKITYYDPWWYGFFDGQGISTPWYYNFFNQGYLADRKRDTSIMNLGATYDSADVTVPASPHPVNFRLTPTTNAGGGGVLHFEYAWDSSTGNLGDLADCVVGELVTYSGSNPYNPPNSPFSASLPNPTVLNVAASDGAGQDNHSPPGFVTPYRSASFRANQRYRYRCGTGKWVNLTGTITITRSVTQNSDGSWKYTISKSGASVEINPLP